MDIEVTGGSLLDQRVDSYVVPIAQGARRLTGDAAAVDGALGGAISRMIASEMITGRSDTLNELPATTRMRAKRVVVVGLGRATKLTSDGLRNATGNLARRLRGIDAGRVAIATQTITGALDAEEAGTSIAEGLTLGLYRFDKHHTNKADRPTGSVESVKLVEGGRNRRTALQRGAERGAILAEAQNFARDLANEPANLMTPTVIAGRAQQLAADSAIECKIIERAEAERLKMGSYLSVSNGSVQPPKFIVLTYRGGRGSRFTGLIGKGITFDTGGISIKPAAGMESMKADMTGAAAVIGAISAIARLELNVNVMAVAPCTENMPSGSATKPGDVVYAMDGQSIEVINTDAEGRLVLADGLAYAKQNGCTSLVDVATLTGAMSVSLGNVRTGVFANNDRLWGELERASARSGEKLWRMPLDEEYERQIKSDVADLKNTGGRPAGSITAAKFLEKFAGATPWAHIDIAGVMTAGSDRGVMVKGISGIPVRTLVQFVLGRTRS
jgi:leucyl aminopeptidase